jgi:uncharacterized cupin superfamily protein
MRRFNLHAPEFDRSSERDGYRWRGARVGAALDADQIGASLYELGEGERSFPYHFHHGNEELLLVVSGSPTVRTPEGERVLRRGDVLCFPVGSGGGHQVTGPGTVLIVSEKNLPEIVEYPDSGKVGVRSPHIEGGQNFRATDAVDYWDGE